MRKLKPQPADLSQICRFLAGAEKKLEAAKKTLALHGRRLCASNVVRRNLGAVDIGHRRLLAWSRSV